MVVAGIDAVDADGLFGHKEPPQEARTSDVWTADLEAVQLSSTHVDTELREIWQVTGAVLGSGEWVDKVVWSVGMNSGRSGRA